MDLYLHASVLYVWTFHMWYVWKAKDSMYNPRVNMIDRDKQQGQKKKTTPVETVAMDLFFESCKGNRFRGAIPEIASVDFRRRKVGEEYARAVFEWVKSTFWTIYQNMTSIIFCFTPFFGRLLNHKWCLQVAEKFSQPGHVHLLKTPPGILMDKWTWCQAMATGKEKHIMLLTQSYPNSLNSCSYKAMVLMFLRLRYAYHPNIFRISRVEAVSQRCACKLSSLFQGLCQTAKAWTVFFPLSDHSNHALVQTKSVSKTQENHWQKCWNLLGSKCYSNFINSRPAIA